MDKPRPSYVTSLSDKQWAEAAVHERALHVARGLVGVREVGANAGTWVGRFLAAVGLGTGYSWCAAFVYYCLITAGADPAKLPPKRQAAGVINWRAWAARENRLGDYPERGKLFFWLDQGQGHIGFCRLGEGLDFSTIEGNTNQKGSREGDGVYTKERNRSDLAGHQYYGFINLRGLE
jgi:hypothetical protein